MAQEPKRVAQDAGRAQDAVAPETMVKPADGGAPAQAPAQAAAKAAQAAAQAHAQQIAQGKAPPPPPPPPPAAPQAPAPAAAPQAPAPAPAAAAPAASPTPSPAREAVPAGRPVPPPASPTYRRGRHVVILLSFLLFVVVPSAVTGFYLYTVAVDQYASKVGFSVRREDANSALGVLSGLTSISNSSSSDTDILFEFIQSQKLVLDIDSDLDLRAIWSKPEEDFVFAIPDEASVEELVDYWNRMVRISYGAGSGLIEVEVLAFDPDDATAISQILFEKSSQMINELSDIARQDSIRYAREELDEALERLKDARAVVTRFRNVNQIVNPEIDIQTQAGLLGNLQNQQAQTLIEIDLLQGTVSNTDPRMVQATRRLEVIENRIAQERRKLGVGGTSEDGTAFADLLGDYERLVVDREFAENSYVSALATYDGALAESRRKTRYLAAYMEPTLAETPAYPKRLTLLALVTLFLGLIWSVLVLVAISVRDRR
ncbi:hypothetical protein [uncultured Sulfitobacter sp.]|uniref:hypothetical protein n=1 Tax=uncultured Sulfitobacter sp. TaxID=191468 RepID=UPI00263334C1|nr:hypothetical protein [uncultured Sulfitobacter sp.]